ncbi:hypothetical protein Bca101_043864 [Brassica carinata]
MAGDFSKQNEAPTVKLNKFRMEAMMSQMMKQIKSTLRSEKETDDFFGNVSQLQKDAKIKRRNRRASRTRGALL